MWHILINNLSRNQKIVIVLVLQIFVILSIVVLLQNVFNSEKDHMVDASANNVNTAIAEDVPNDLEVSFEKTLWNVLSMNVDGLDENKVDYTVREGSYEFNDSDGASSATFLVDIDSLKQTYAVSIAWSGDNRKGSMPPDILINCPPLNQMKYPETVCQGMYNNTYSMDLYFPYDGYDADGNTVWIIEGDDATKTITIESSVCDLEKYNAEALDYIKKNTPYFNNPDYQIVYETNIIDVACDIDADI